jgi:hypothetical protein
VRGKPGYTRPSIGNKDTFVSNVTQPLFFLRHQTWRGEVEDSPGFKTAGHDEEAFLPFGEPANVTLEQLRSDHGPLPRECLI